MRFLFQGDSITNGNRGRTDDPNHIMGHGYAFSIASRLSADFPEKKLEFFNRGVSGNSHVEMEARWQTDTLDLKPDVLSILIGTNGSRQLAGIKCPWDNKTNTEYHAKQSLDHLRLIFKPCWNRRSLATENLEAPYLPVLASCLGERIYSGTRTI